ncbi:acyl--CoA ligase [Yinghuangia sp. ASG 101]|uniref:class I adenylate-forming enzyme family protein n=1 Tax=Yinghuangia sp. ASG 101 TaxID=2896848 RepID=UPI001E4AEE5A|nr:class I adenylate-forming enzyme family protein [Yinghuangia sp. ASG 101]UGQ12499.1 acyl--CoA ligase [Yinghuangia sp. ASG 101]
MPTREQDGTRDAAHIAAPPVRWTIPELLAARRRHDAATQAVVSDDEAVTYTELDDASRASAARLVRAGVTKGSRVGLLMPNGVDWAVTALAVMRVGAVLVPLSTLLKPAELLPQLRIAAVSHLILVERFKGRAYLDELDAAEPELTEHTRGGRRHAAVPSLRQTWTWRDLPADPAPTEPVDALETVVRPADDMAVLFTSGSRGTPKGIIHTHGNALRATAATLDDRRIGAGERLYIPMPFFWTGGFSGGLLTTLLAGGTLLTEAEPEPGRTIRFLEREGATLFRGWPDQAARIAAHPAFADADLSALRPASLPAVLGDRQPRPGARPNLFGMTETFGPYCGAPMDRDLPEDKHGSLGRPFAAVDVRVTDPDTGRAVPDGTEGEIRLRGSGVMRGICGRHRSEVFTPDGYYRTGDLAVRDADGYLWFRGRLDDMVKVKGATVYPVEVEAALRGIPGVSEAHVTDIPGDTTRLIAALVVATPDVRQPDLVEAARARLSGFKIPTRWLVTADPAEVPRLAGGKVDVAALRHLLTGP